MWGEGGLKFQPLYNCGPSQIIRGVSTPNEKDNKTTTNKAPMMIYCYSSKLRKP